MNGMTAGKAKYLVQSFAALDEWMLHDPDDEGKHYAVERLDGDHVNHSWKITLYRRETEHEQRRNGYGYHGKNLWEAVQYALSHDSMRGISQ